MSQSDEISDTDVEYKIIEGFLNEPDFELFGSTRSEDQMDIAERWQPERGKQAPHVD